MREQPIVEPARGPSSFDAFATSERVRLVRLGWVLSGDLSAAEDVAQDALAEVFRRWDGLDDPGAYARRVVANRLTSRWRRRVNESKAVDRFSQDRSGVVLMPEPSAEVWRAVRRLPLRQRVAVAMSVIEDRPVEDIAEVLGCSPETARTHLRRGRERLASLLAHLKEPS